MRLSIFHSTSRALREFFLVLVQGYERAPRVSQLPITYKVPGETPAPSEVDTTKLAAAIEKAEGLNESDYTADSWKALQSALAEADTALKEKTHKKKTYPYIVIKIPYTDKQIIY